MSASNGWRDPSERQLAAHLRSHELRLANLTKAGIVTAVEHSDRGNKALAWEVPEDFEEKAIALDLKQGRASGVKLLSRLDLKAQLASPGATWLDRAQVDYGKGGIERISAKTSIFVKELDTAFQQRREWLIKQGYAELRQEEHKASIIWESHHAQKWGKRIKGRVLSGGGIDWDVGRSRGIGR